MHFLLVGHGALGCLLASYLSRGLAGTDVRLSLLDHNPERADFINRQGILCDQQDKQHKVPITAVASPEHINPVDVIILCVKSYDIPACLHFCQPLLLEGTLLIFMQNGISHLDCQHLAGKACCAFGTTTEGATLVNRGHVRHAGKGNTYLGFLTNPGDHAEKLLEKTAGLFADGGLTISITNDILNRLWAKLFVNVGINALTAILDCTNGDLLHIPGIPSRMKTAVEEAETIARKLGIGIATAPYPAAVEVCQKTANNFSSMLQDIRNKRRTEIDAINGAIVQHGMELNIATPENLQLVKQVKEIEDNFSSGPALGQDI